MLKICTVGLYTEQFYAIILTLFSCSAIPASCYSPNCNAHSICISAGEDFVDSSHQIAFNSSSIRTCVSIAIMNNRAVEETVETFMVVLHSSDPYVMLNPGATISINDTSSKSVLMRECSSVLSLGMSRRGFYLEK